jgi:hypothetical protein
VGIAAIGAVVLSLFSVWFFTAMFALFRKRGYISRHV